MSEVPVQEGCPAFLVYDLEKDCILRELTDYATYQIDERGNSSLTVGQGLHHLVEFWTFLQNEGTPLRSVSNATIRKFKAENFKKVKKSKAHRGGDDQAKKTVNVKLERIYQWIVWLQETGRVPVGTIGRRGLVVAIIESKVVRKRSGGRWVAGSEKKYPLLFKVGKRNAKHNAAGSVVTDKDVSDLMAYFSERFDPFVAQRNSLFADIAESAGFRRGSICSLRIDQFDMSEIETAEGEYLVRPPKQKLSYTKTFGIELALAYRICEFIENYWKPWVMEHKVLKSVHKNALFLSEKTGKPILERSMTQVISRAFRSLGFDKGIGPHILRGKFASTFVDEELAERRELGLDTSNRSIAAAAAMKLGHDDPDQFYGYASSSQARLARIAREGRLAELKALRDEVKTLREQVRQLSGV
ncbi:tyrosine-type recombinase/integrase [Roseateles sp. DB2]|uniref:tyrosine-type recombinase/integrase n=1 Tax=Roseateles sp. DB2 TaxID=3453717 RepID=UPI003EEA91E7